MLGAQSITSVLGHAGLPIVGWGRGRHQFSCQTFLVDEVTTLERKDGSLRHFSQRAQLSRK